jgi:16S rRNA (cytosine1402-N4)-methyltransferase
MTGSLPVCQRRKLLAHMAGRCHAGTVLNPSESNDAASRPRRRVRYAGKNPRRFAEKYKEHGAADHAAEVAHIMASGKTPAGMHRPILVAELCEVLSPAPGEIAVDCTLGYGGHARELLARIVPGGRLIGFDIDPVEQPKTVARLREAGFGDAVFTAVHGNFAGLAQALARLGLPGADVVMADLGVSSMQLDDPVRGFTFKEDGPLDSRMNPQRGQPASALLARLSAVELASMLRAHADEPHADALAAELWQVQQTDPFTRTGALARWLTGLARDRGWAREREEQTALVRRVFQALRIAVNDEFGALDAWLRTLPYCLSPGGRVAVLTFHSGEDRRVKQAFRDGQRQGIYARIANEVIRPSPDEVRSNPRAAPAKLRWAVRSAT